MLLVLNGLLPVGAREAYGGAKEVGNGEIATATGRWEQTTMTLTLTDDMGKAQRVPRIESKEEGREERGESR